MVVCVRGALGTFGKDTSEVASLHEGGEDGVRREELIGAAVSRGDGCIKIPPNEEVIGGI